ncbi:ROK family glucokinase [Haloactinopolyspora sp.]|uniref:ROK family glucokinase n=1 Tax=Haloactinopolyspora sp. TaxID=1966353 RepID=UPI002607EB60|nr:ROK family glucokinase [Haloactinopolyspora sp.]
MSPTRARVARLALRPTIGIDIGGTKVAAGVVDVDGQVIDRARRETPSKSKSAQVVEDTIADIVAELAGRHHVLAVGIGAAGFVDGTQSSVLFAPHLAWRNEPLRDAVRKRVGLPVVVDNDANAAAWAECRFGAAQGESHVVCVTLGTGIGGALVLDGVLHRGRFGVAGEFGHMVVVPGGHRCECGNRGCWEQYASGNALVREARELVVNGSPVGHRIAEACGGDYRRITGPMISDLAREGDPAAVELLEEVGHWLGTGLANLAAALDPGLFVIGGGVSDVGELMLAPATASLRRSLTGRGFRPEAGVVRAALGNEAGLIGAADLARRERLRRRDRAKLVTTRLLLPRRLNNQNSTRVNDNPEHASGTALTPGPSTRRLNGGRRRAGDIV